MAKHLEMGKHGEALATEFLQKKGYSILERNYRFGRAEVDIIGLIGSELVFVEVKTRNSSFFGFPEESITDRKIELMREAADNYVEENALEFELRFDLISLVIENGREDIYHLEDAF